MPDSPRGLGPRIGRCTKGGWHFRYAQWAECDPATFKFTIPADPHPSLRAFQALCFSLGTLGGFAYGDIVPLSNSARILAAAEATVSMFYLAVLIARVVSMYSGAGEPEPPAG